jgi:hypothetical protein
LLGLFARAGAAHGHTAPVYNPANGHWYQVVVTGPITWYAARQQAESLSHAGYRGHLVSITSPAENDFILANVTEIELWIGAYQDRGAPDYWEPGGGWRWTTGEPFLFNHWLGEPNNANGIEDAAVYRRHIGWNDMSCGASARGFIVEYEPAAPHGSGSEARPNLLFNGSFELPGAGASWTNLNDGQLPGWRITRANVDVVGSGYWPAAPGQGTQSLDLAGGAPGTIEQSFATVPGQEYSFSGWMSHNPVNSGVREGRAVVSVNGLPLAQLIHSDPHTSFRDMRWVPFAYRFRAVAQVTTLAIADYSTLELGVGMALDGLSVTAVSASLLINGSFEQPDATTWGDGVRTTGELPGWRILQGNVDVVHDRYWQAAPGAGRHSLDLVGTSPGVIEQSFSTEPGRLYLFSGWISHNIEIAEGRANVFQDGQPIGQLYHSNALYGPTTRADMRWQPFSLTLRATSHATSLRLADVTGIWYGGGLALDGLSVAPVGDPPHQTPLGAPFGLAVRLVAPTQVDLTWSDGSQDETGFELYRRDGSGLWTWIATVGAGVTRFADFNLRPATTYAYRVRARNDRGVSPWSNEAFVTTLAP